MKKDSENFTGVVGDAISNSPTFPKDVLQPTIQGAGKIISRIPHAINAAFSALDKWILNKEYNVDETKQLLAQKLEKVDPKKIITPEIYVAVPAIQAISYSMNSIELRNLYANLLAKAMNSDTKDLVHPSFIEIIKQMSPNDAVIFRELMKRRANPIVNLVLETQENGLLIIQTNISDFDMKNVENTCISIDNLIKHGLISTPAGRYYSDSKLYEKILLSDYFLEQKRQYATIPKEYKFNYKKGMIIKTNLGISFYNVCVNELGQPPFSLSLKL